jgi:hypothetical protein
MERTMNVKNLRLLETHLRKLQDDPERVGQFNMCGWASCALGEATKIPEFGMRLMGAPHSPMVTDRPDGPHSDKESIVSASRVFGITKGTAFRIFDPIHYHDVDAWGHVTPVMVADRIDEIIRGDESAEPTRPPESP